MCRYIFFIFISLFLFKSEIVFSQDNSQQKIPDQRMDQVQQASPMLHPNSIYLEALGSGGLYSINYDRMFIPNLGARIGFSYLSFEDMILLPAMTLYMFPVSFNYLSGSGNSKLELGAGMNIVTGDFQSEWLGYKGSATAAIPFLNVGYRYQPLDGGFVFRICLTPLISSEGIMPWGGISLGSAF